MFSHPKQPPHQKRRLNGAAQRNPVHFTSKSTVPKPPRDGTGPMAAEEAPVAAPEEKYDFVVSSDGAPERCAPRFPAVHICRKLTYLCASLCFLSSATPLRGGPADSSSSDSDSEDDALRVKKADAPTEEVGLLVLGSLVLMVKALIHPLFLAPSVIAASHPLHHECPRLPAMRVTCFLVLVHLLACRRSAREPARRC